MHGWGWWNMGWMMFWWWALGLALIAALFWFAFAGRGPLTRHETPEEILKRRYASGEIDRDTYQRMLGDLRGERRPPDRPGLTA